MQVAIIADDLTGAADAGVQFAHSGYRTAVAFRGTPVPPAPGLDAVALDTDSRSMPAGAAARRVSEAALAARNARIVYKKLDSTLRGPIAAELRAALKASGRERIVVAAAFPAAGRTTVGGVQLVHGVPVQETEARDDPSAPVREGHIPTLLAGALSPISTLGVGDLLGDGDPARRRLAESRCVVADAERAADLEALVRAVPDPSAVLWAGSAGLALALGRVYPGPRSGDTPDPADPATLPNHRVLVVVGSLSEAARGQIGRLVEEYGEGAVVEVSHNGPKGEALARAGAALESGGCATIYSARRRNPSSDARRKVAGALAEVVAGLAEGRLFDALVLTGGATAVGVARRLGATGIRLEGEAEAGVPVGALIGPRTSYPVVTKAGGFGGPETLVNAVETLRSRSGKG